MVGCAARWQPAASGSPPQRLQVASLLLSAPQHLSAEQITEALRRSGTRVSKATVYNTLNLFAARGLIRQLNVDGNCAWFDSNVAPHYHFHDEQTGALLDVGRATCSSAACRQPPPGHGSGRHRRGHPPAPRDS